MDENLSSEQPILHQLDKIIKKNEHRYYVSDNEIKWMQKNKKYLEELRSGHSLLNENCELIYLGGLVYSCSILNDKRRKEIATALGCQFIIDAKERIGHLEYLKNDMLTWQWFNPLDWIKRKDLKELDAFIEHQRQWAERDVKKYINEKTYVDWKINEFVIYLKENGIKRERDFVSIIYYIFKKCNYEHYGSTGDNVKESDHKNTIRWRLNNISKKENLETIFKIWKTE